MSNEVKQTQQFILRAMAKNYAGGHNWDHMDSEACTKAADEIATLEAECEQLKERLSNRAAEHIDDFADLLRVREERDALAAELAAIKAQEPAHWWVDGVEYCQKPFTNDWHPHHALPPVAGQVKS